MTASESTLPDYPLQEYRFVPLTHGYVALIDAEDYPLVNQHRWYVKIEKSGHVRARTSLYLPERIRRSLFMHRLIFDAPDGLLVDHRNGNALDNRRANLRSATQSQNQHNQHRRRGASRYKGVSYQTRDRMWSVKIRTQGNDRYVGMFKDEETAARAYDAVARKEHGEYANLNFPEEG